MTTATVATGVVAIPGPFQVIKPPQPSSTSTWKDVPYAVLFVANVVAIVAVMVSLGLPLLQAATTSSSSSGQANATASSSEFTSGDMATVVAVAAALAVVSAIVAYLLLQVVLMHAKHIILYSLWANVILCFVFAAAAIASGVVVLALLFIVFGFFSLCYLRAVQSRILFAGANLQVAAAAVKKHWSIFPVAFALMAVQVAWVFIWAIALVGVFQKATSPVPNLGASVAGTSCSASSECESDVCAKSSKATRLTCQPFIPGQAIVTYFFMLVSLYWGVNVVKYLLHTTVAGTVATWWAAGDSQSATGGAFRRAMTTSFGSICMGSLLVAILEALESMAKEARKKGNGAACVAECILNMLRGILEYINRWAFVYVGMYGFPFAHAGKAVYGLFQTRGLSAIVNDDLIGAAMGSLSLACGLICALLALAYTYIDTAHTSFDGANLILPLVGLAFGVGVTVIPLSVVSSAVATVFVCFAEDPAALSRTHPELHNEMVGAWRLAHPDAMVAFYPL